MKVRRAKTTIVAAFSLLSFLFCLPAFAQQTAGETGMEEEHHPAGEEKFDASEVIFGHVLDAHEFHFFSYKSSDGTEHHATVPLPVILYSPQKGFSTFMSSRFEHGHATVDGYKMEENKIVPTEPGVTVYDLSLTRNVVQMFIAVGLLLWLMTGIARRYKTGQGITS